jgi:hypothetical protein
MLTAINGRDGMSQVMSGLTCIESETSTQRLRTAKNLGFWDHRASERCCCFGYSVRHIPARTGRVLPLARGTAGGPEGDFISRL